MSGIRSVQRALMVLRTMNERPIWSLKELQSRTGLPKSTLHRILAALQDEHYVRCDEGMYGYYQLTSAVLDLSKGVTQKNRLVDIAAPILVAATKRIKWPLSIGTVVGCEMYVSFCTMPYSPYAIRPSSFGRRYNMFHSALGAAYFAFCGRAERRILYDLLKRQNPLPDALPPPAALRTLIRQTQERGYGLRYGRQASDSSAFAVPIICGDDLLGALSYSTFSRALDEERLKTFVPVLQETVSVISQQWQAAG